MGLISKKLRNKISVPNKDKKYRPMIRSRHPSHSRLRYEMKDNKSSPSDSIFEIDV